jgi:flagellar biosynthetic protein FlhB
MAAEDPGQSKTELPTQHRRDEARKQGQFAISLDFTSSIQLLAGIAVLWWSGRAIAGGLLEAMQHDLRTIHTFEITPVQVREMATLMFLQAASVGGFLVGFVFVCVLGVSAFQVGFHLTPELFSLRWDRLSFSTGWSRMLSSASGIRALMAVVKTVIIVCVGWWVLRAREGQIASLGDATLATGISQSWQILIRLVLAVGAALVLIGLVDYTYQRIRHDRSLMMTRQELKEEMRREEGDPQTRGRMRRTAREVARRRMMLDVPKASVVITNPTHLAIALHYERGVTSAPRVVAKGAGLVAQRIIALARNHAVPVVERKPLARALFKSVPVGQTIPAALYYAAAEVLAYVYRLRSAA